MSSLPSISHHLFVAAVRHDSRGQPKPPQNQPTEKSYVHQIASADMPTGEFTGDRADHEISGSPLVTET
jgi:hypothetical protein